MISLKLLPGKIRSYRIIDELHSKTYHDNKGKNKRRVYFAGFTTGSVVIIKTSSHENQEADIIKTLDHPRAVKFLEDFKYKFFFFFSRYALVTDYAGSQDLSDVVKGKNPFLRFENPDEKLYFAKGLAEFINYLHIQKRIVHGDIRPEHFMFERGLDSWKLVDYDNSRSIDDSKSIDDGGPGIIRGRDRDIDFCAPEISQGQTPETDMYSFGAILYFVNSKRPPFQYYSQKLTEKPDLRQIPQDLKALVGSLLEYRLENRPTSEEAVKELDMI